MSDLNLNAEGSKELYLYVMKEIIGETSDKTFLDLACCNCSITSELKWKQATLCDVEDSPDRVKPFGEFFLADILKPHPIFDHQYDVVFIGDGIEHLQKYEGIWMMERMRLMTKRGGVSLLFTPRGDYVVDPSATSPHAHRSGWMPAELSELGWNVEYDFPNWHRSLNFGAFFAYKRKP